MLNHRFLLGTEWSAKKKLKSGVFISHDLQRRNRGGGEPEPARRMGGGVEIPGFFGLPFYFVTLLIIRC